MDVDYRLINSIRSKSYQGLKSQNVKNLGKSFDLLGCTILFYPGWIIYQLYGEMTSENYSDVCEVDHVYLLSKTNLSDENEMIKSIISDILRPT